MKRKFIIAIITALSLCCIIPASSAYTVKQMGTLAYEFPDIAVGNREIYIHNNYVYMINYYFNGNKGLYRFDMNGDLLSHEWECIGFEDEAVTGLAFLGDKMVVTTTGNLCLFDLDSKSVIKTFDKQQLSNWGNYSSFINVVQDEKNPETVYATFIDINGCGQSLKTANFGNDWVYIERNTYPLYSSIGYNETPYIVFYGKQQVYDCYCSFLSCYNEGEESVIDVDLPNKYFHQYTYHLAILDDDRWAVSAMEDFYIVSKDRKEFMEIDNSADYYYCYEDYVNKNSNEKALFATRSTWQNKTAGQFVMISNYDGTPEIKVLAEIVGCLAWRTIKYADNQFIMLTTKGTFLLEISDDEICGISETTTETPETSTLFDLQGRKLESTPSQGLYIQNGRKVMK